MESKITVAQVTYSLIAGGSEMYAFTIAGGLDQSRYRSIMVALDKGGALEPEIERKGIPYHIMKRRSGIDVRLMWRLYRLFKQHGVTVVHTHHFTQLLYSALGAKLAGARIIHMEHSVEEFKQKKLRKALKLLSALCYKITVIGEDGARAMTEQVGIPASRLEIIKAGVNTEPFEETREEARRMLSLESAVPIATIVARLSPEKNHSVLLDAFALVVQALPAAKLLLVGEGPERASIEAQIADLSLQDSVVVFGVRRDIRRILAATDVFVLSSEREGLPIAVLEAMAAGLPVVATAVGDIPSLIHDGETGYTVPAKAPSELASALIKALGDPEAARTMGANGRSAVDSKFGLQTMISKLENLYSS